MGVKILKSTFYDMSQDPIVEGAPLCGRWAVVSKHDVEGSGKVVGERAAAAFIHEGQQQG